MCGVEVIDEEAERRDLPDTPVRFFSIIPDQVLHELHIKRIQIIDTIDVAANKLILEGLIESFQIRMGLREFKITEEFNEVVLLAELIEVFMEFAAVIGLDSGDREWSDIDEFLEGVAAVC